MNVMVGGRMVPMLSGRTPLQRRDAVRLAVAAGLALGLVGFARLLSLGSWPAAFGLGLENAVLGCLFASLAIVMYVQAHATEDSRSLPMLGTAVVGFVLAVAAMLADMAVESAPGSRLAGATDTGLWLDVLVTAVVATGVAVAAGQRPRRLVRARTTLSRTLAIAVVVGAVLVTCGWALGSLDVAPVLGTAPALTRTWTVVCTTVGFATAAVVPLVGWLDPDRQLPARLATTVALSLAAASSLVLAHTGRVLGTGWHLGNALLVVAIGVLFIGQLRVVGRAMAGETLRIRELTLLQAAARELSESLDLPAVRCGIVRHAFAMLSAGDGAPRHVWLARLSNDELVLTAGSGESGCEGALPGPPPSVALSGHARLRHVIARAAAATFAGDPFGPEEDSGTGRSLSIAVPVVIDGEVMGVIGATCERTQPFDDDQLHALQRLADVAGLALDNAWTFREETRMVARLRGLAARSADIVASASFDDALARVLRAACDLTASRGAEIALLAEDGLHLDRHAACDLAGARPPRLVLDPPLMAADPMPGPQRSAFRLPDLPAGDALARACRDAGITSLAAVPLLHQGVMLGTLYVTGKRDEVELVHVLTEYDERDMVALSTLAVGAAAAIQNARLVHRLEDVAEIDPLTRLPNRRAFERLRASQPAEPYCVLAIDVDNLKVINDEGGHEAGDAVLRTVGDALRASVREGDFAGRIGGDEFVVVAMTGSVEMTDALSRRVQRVLYGSPVPHGHARVSVGAARGAAGQPIERTWREADAMTVRAKASGGDCIVWRSAAERRPGAVSWEEVIDAALAPGGLRSVFQPIVRLDDGCLLGMEALARPARMDAGTSVEGLFAAAQRLGRMRDLDWACRRVAVESAGRLPRGVPLFVNVSAGALCDPMHSVDQMELLLTWASLRPSEVVLEITERERVSDLARLQAVVAEYRAAGFRFAVDDLGEGHGSMATLVTIAPEFQKLAKDMLDRGNLAATGVVAALGSFAAHTGGAVIAEGIEDPGGVEWLVARGIAYGQGFGISRPLEAAQAAELIRSGRVELGRSRARRRPRGAAFHLAEPYAVLAWPPHVAQRRRPPQPGVENGASALTR